ncbi:DUF7710 domain-containing protein [Dactylosporangium darangshiense]|uniref:DUF7710 domain-containing protein n=1 Tax=Dactylosporangium darangshiense TaxID=579108 RepID=UPI003CD05AEE
MPDGGPQASTSRQDPGRTTMWIFQGERARYASGLFESLDAGLVWAARHRLTGILAEYCFGGTYDLAVDDGRFRPSRPHHGSPEHVAGLSPGLRHVHLVDGRPDE